MRFLQLAEEGVTHECGGLFPQLLQLLLGQISLQAEVGAVDGQFDVFRKVITTNDKYRTELDALVLDYVKRLSKKGVSVKSLHEEYQKEHPDGYQYTQFKLAPLPTSVKYAPLATWNTWLAIRCILTTLNTSSNTSYVMTRCLRGVYEVLGQHPPCRIPFVYQRFRRFGVGVALKKQINRIYS